MGDTTSLGPRYPTIDYANGGSINGIINTVNNYLAITNGQTKYVPGHGPLSTRADIARYRDMLTAVRYLVRAEIQANKTEDEAVADKPLAPSAIPSFFEIKESGEVCTLSEKNLIVIF
jgi:ribosomal protein L30/L7E